MVFSSHFLLLCSDVMYITKSLSFWMWKVIEVFRVLFLCFPLWCWHVEGLVRRVVFDMAMKITVLLATYLLLSDNDLSQSVILHLYLEFFKPFRE